VVGQLLKERDHCQPDLDVCSLANTEFKITIIPAGEIKFGLL
jgi:hypothetical protein